MKRVVAEMNMSEITIAYGMTETSPVSFQSSTDDRWSGVFPPWAVFIPMSR